MKKLIVLSIMSAWLMTFAQTSANSQVSAQMAAQMSAQVKRAIVGFTHAPTGQRIWIVEVKNATAAQIEAAKQEQIKQELLKISAEKLNNVKDVDVKKIDFGWQPEVSALTKAIVGTMNEASAAYGDNCNAASLAMLVQNAPVQLTNDLMIDVSQLSEGTQACLRK